MNLPSMTGPIRVEAPRAATLYCKAHNRETPHRLTGRAYECCLCGRRVDVLTILVQYSSDELGVERIALPHRLRANGDRPQVGWQGRVR